MTPGEAYTAAALALAKGDAEAARALLSKMLPTDAGIMREKIYEAETKPGTTVPHREGRT